MIVLYLWPLPKSSHLLFPRHISSSIPQSSSRLRDIYGFTPPPSFSQNPYSDLKAPNSNPKTPKKEKPQYRPPSSIDPATTKKIRTTLSFDFRYSYTESSELKADRASYLPFGSGRIDRPWTGVCAPALEVGHYCEVGRWEGGDRFGGEEKEDEGECSRRAFE
ncbi:hypothetical protein QQ045_026882 [Rhodiola kirilowii]